MIAGEAPRHLANVNDAQHHARHGLLDRRELELAMTAARPLPVEQ